MGGTCTLTKDNLNGLNNKFTELFIINEGGLSTSNRIEEFRKSLVEKYTLLDEDKKDIQEVFENWLKDTDFLLYTAHAFDGPNFNKIEETFTLLKRLLELNGSETMAKILVDTNEAKPEVNDSHDMTIINSDFVALFQSLTYATLNQIYGDAQQVRNEMESNFKNLLVKSLIVDFDRGILLDNLADYNKKLTEELENLTLNIVAYAKSKGIETSLSLYDKEGNLSGRYGDLYSLAVQLFENVNSDQLNSAFSNRSLGNNDLFIKAFNSWIMIKNFDMLIDHMLGNSVIIDANYVNSMADASVLKYKFNTISNLVKTWRTSEDISAIDELGNITKLLLETTDVYDYKTKKLRTNQKLSIKDFMGAFGQVFSHPKLLNMAVLVRYNPTYYTPKLIETALQDNIRFTDNNHVKSILYSVQQHFFRLGNKGTKAYSLAEIVNLNTIAKHNNFIEGQNLLNFITATIDKTISNTFINYLPDDTGTITLTFLRSGVIGTYKLLVRNNISNSNSAMQDIAVQALLNKYQFEQNKGTASLWTIKIPMNNSDTLNFTFYNSIKDVKIKNITITKRNGNEITNPDYNDIKSTLLRMIDDTTFMSLSALPEIINRLVELYPEGVDESLIVKDLAKLSARILVAHKLQNTKNLKNQDLAKAYGLSKDAKTTDLIDSKTHKIKYLLNDNFTNVVIERLALARMAVNGDLQKSVLRNLDNTTVSANGLTNMANTIRHIWQDAADLTNIGSSKYDEKCATGSCLFVQLPNLFRGIAIKSQALSSDRVISKADKNFEIGESLESALKYDFLLQFGLSDITKDEEAIIFILPTVYSDKSRNLLAQIDLKQSINGSKRIIDMTPKEILDIHRESMGDMYYLVQENLQEDYKAIFAPILDILINPNNTTFNTDEPLLDLSTMSYIDFKNTIFPLINSIMEDVHRKDTGLKAKGILLYYQLIQQKVSNNAASAYDSNISFIPFTPLERLVLKAINENNKNILNILNLLINTDDASTLFDNLAVQTNTNNVINVHRVGKGNLKTNKVLDFYFDMFISDDASLYEHEINLNKFRYAKMLSLNTILYFYDNKRRYDQIFNKAIRRLAQKTGIQTEDEFDEFRKEYIEQWVDKETGRLKIGFIGDTEINRRTCLDGLEFNSAETVLLNPLIDLYYTIDYVMSSLFITSTVGGCFQHKDNFGGAEIERIPGESDYDYEIRVAEQEEAGRALTLFKRMVIFPATMHNYGQEQINGIGTHYNVAIINDVKAKVCNYLGDSGTIDAQDGAGYVLPWVSILENYSLNDAAAGQDKKPIASSMNNLYLVSTELKYALFAFSNERIIDSANSRISLEHIIKKMSDNAWDIPVDLTMNFLGQNINFKEVFKLPHYFARKDANGITQNYRIDNIEKAEGPNQYKITYTRVIRTIDDVSLQVYLKDEATTSENVEINSNYKLWKMFGGQYSEHFENGLWVFDDSSNEKVAWYCNNIGRIRTKENYKELHMELIHESPEDLVDNESILRNKLLDGTYTLTQKDVYLPLKYSDIHYLVNASATKNGQINVNPTSSWYDETPLRSIIFDTRHAGILMDADHHADDSELTEMSLVISALESNGWAHDIVKLVYSDLGAIVASTMKTEFDAILLYFKYEDTTELYKTVGKAFLQSYQNSSNKANLTDTIVYNLRNALNELADVSELNIPFSDNNILSLAIATITAKFNKLAIKRKYAGLGAVMCPAYDIIKIFNVRGKDYTGTGIFRENIDLQKELESAPVLNNSQLEFGKSYILYLPDGSTLEIELDDIQTYRKYRFTNNGVFKENIPKGRNLQPSHTTFKSNGELFDIYDVDEILDRIIFSEWYSKLKKIKAGNIDTIGLRIATYIQLNPIPVQAFGNGTGRIDAETQGIIDRINNAIATGTYYQLNTYLKFLDIALSNRVVEVFKTINNDNEVGTVYILGIQRKVDHIMDSTGNMRTSAVTKEAELVVSKIFAQKFGLRHGDRLDQVNTQFFVNRLTDSLAITAPLSDIILKRSSGNHINIILSGSENENFLKKSELYLRVDTRVITDYGTGNKTLVDNNGEAILPFNGDTQLYKDTHGNTYIVTDNIEQYTDLLDEYDSLWIESYDGYKKVNPENIDNIIRENFNDYYKAQKEHEQTLISRLARLKWTSFLQSLSFIAARIPSLSLQSFMPMKVVGFTESEENKAYVSHSLIYLLGSDYDIDKVYLLGNQFSKAGTYIGWSTLFDLTSIETLKASLQLPMPTGETHSIWIGKRENTVDITNEANEWLDAYTMYNLAAGYNEKFDIELRVNLLKAYKKVIDKINSTNQNLSWNLDYDSEEERRYLESLVEKLERDINKHNMYISNTKNEKKVLDMVKNSVSSKIYRVISTPENLVAAHSPIEMEEPKEAAAMSPFGKAEREYSTMNPGVKSVMHYLNMIGKKDIGITAVGEKVLFALLFYFNEAARANPTTEEGRLKQQRAFFYHKFGLKRLSSNKRLDIVRTVVANINFADASTSVWAEEMNKIIDTILQKPISDDEKLFEIDILMSLFGLLQDSALVNSALLSAATDNAKELILAKINANPNMLKVLTYGIILGIDFNDIAQLMISPTVSAINQLSSQNIFNPLMQSVTVKSAITKIKRGLTTKEYGLIGTNATNSSSSNSNSALIGQLINDFDGKGKGLSFWELALDLLNPNSNFEYFVQQVLVKIESWKHRLREEYSGEDIMKLKAFRFLEDLGNLAILLKDTNRQELLSFEELFNLADEFNSFGAVLGINQGIATDTISKINYLDKIENLVNKRIRQYVKDGRLLLPDNIINIIEHEKPYLSDFGIDHSEIARRVYDAEELGILTDFNALSFFLNPEYLRTAIELMDIIKGTINTLDVLINLPHFSKMVEATIVDFTLFDRVSNKFSLTYNIAHSIKSLLGFLNDTTKERINRGVLTYFGDVITKKFFKEKNIKFKVGDNTKVFDHNAKLLSVKSEEVIDLLFAHGLASFKYWMENVVIPRLKLGYISDSDDNIDQHLADNKFIRDLMLTSSNKTLTGDLKYQFTLPINMSYTENDADMNIYINYLTAFNKLSLFLYNGYSIPELFFYYNLIVNRNQYGLDALTRIFEDLLKKNNGSNALNDYFDFVGQLDKNRMLSQKDFSFDDLLMSVAPIVGRSLANGAYLGKYIKIWNYRTKSFDIYKYSKQSNNTYWEDEDVPDFFDIYEELDWHPKNYTKISLGNSTVSTGTVINYFPMIETNYISVNEKTDLRSLLKDLYRQGKIIIYNNC